ncbi:MAG: C39 family peptidase [Alphaproteobacteria bacterium]|nr:C39 family peptidase [Alphaproteobacteria bacterium]
MPTLPQRQSNWCWAASAEMAMRYLGLDVPQCVQASYEFRPPNDGSPDVGRNKCCDAPSTNCNQGGWPQFSTYHFDASNTSNAPLSFEQIRTEIDAKRPVLFSWHWVGNGGHMMVIVGYVTIGNLQYVVVNDPEPYTDLNEPDGGTRTTMSYETYVSGWDHTHWNDYYDIHFRG